MNVPPVYALGTVRSPVLETLTVPVVVKFRLVAVVVMGVETEPKLPPPLLEKLIVVEARP